jgi:hypothetical protein
MLRVVSLMFLMGYLVLLPGCGGQSTEESINVLPSQSKTTGEIDIEKVEGTNVVKPSDPGQVTEVTFFVNESGFTGPSNTPEGWTRILLENSGERDGYHMALIRLTDGKTVEDLNDFLESNPAANLPDWAKESGGPADVSPGVVAKVTQKLEAGSYALATYVLDDNEIARVDTQFLRGIEVTSSSNVGIEPTPDVVLTITDFDYTIRKTSDLFGQAMGKAINPGMRIIKIKNMGTHVFEARISQIEGGKKAHDFSDLYILRQEMGGGQGMGGAAMGRSLPFPVIKADGTGPGGPPPGTSIGGVMAIQPGGTVYFTADLRPANYFVYNLLEDREMGTSYLMRPMVIEFPVQ